MNWIKVTDEELLNGSLREVGDRLGCSRMCVSIERRRRGLTQPGPPRKKRKQQSSKLPALRDRIRAVYAHPIDVAFLETLGRGDA